HRVAGQQGAKVIVPDRAWDCGMSEGIPSPESGTLAFEMEVTLDRTVEIGKTQYGNRRVAVGQAGTVKGPKLSATVMPGALDLELTLSNGTIEIEQILVLRATDGKYIYVRN